MSLSEDVDLILMEWANWMRDDRAPQKFPRYDMTYRFARFGEAAAIPDTAPPAEMPYLVKRAEYAIQRLPGQCIEFIKAWYGVDKYKKHVNPNLLGNHPTVVAARRRTVQAALQITRGERADREKRSFQELQHTITLLGEFLD